MSDLISREKAINTAHSMRKVCDTDNIDDYHDLIVAALNDLPPSDAVEVVRCRECRYFNSTFPLLHMCDISWMKMESDEYCSLGERKDDQHQ